MRGSVTYHMTKLRLGELTIAEWWKLVKNQPAPHINLEGEVPSRSTFYSEHRSGCKY
jgi:hypothetical protein